MLGCVGVSSNFLHASLLLFEGNKQMMKLNGPKEVSGANTLCNVFVAA